MITTWKYNLKAKLLYFLELEENGHETNKPYGAVKHAYDENNRNNNSYIDNNNQEKSNGENVDEDDSAANDKTFVPTENLKLPVGMLTVSQFEFVYM